MKKPVVFALSGVAIAALVYAGATWWTGSKTQAVYEQKIAQLQHRYPGLRVIDHQYQRGFWQSTGTFTLQYGTPVASAPSSETSKGTSGLNSEEQSSDGQKNGAASDEEALKDAQAALNASKAEDAEEAAEDPEDPSTWRADSVDDDAEEDEEESPPIFITLKQTDVITHGPLPALSAIAPARIDSTLTLDGRSSPELTETLKDKVLATARTSISFSGNFSSKLEGPPLTWKTLNGETWSWKGFQASATGTDNAERFNYEFTTPGLLIDGEEEGIHVSVNDISIRGIDKTSDALWSLSGRDEGQAGDLKIHVNKTAEDEQPFDIHLKNVQFQQSSKTSGDFLDNTLHTSGTGSVGDLPINGFEMNSSLKRLHVPTYLKMLEQSAKQADQPTVDTPDELSGNDLITLLSYNPELSVDKFVLDIDGKRGEASYKLSMPGITPEEQDVPLSLLAMSRLRMDAQADLPTSWLEWIAQTSLADEGADLTPEGSKAMVDGLIEQKLLVRSGDDRVKTHVLFEQGKLTFNGQEFQGL